MEKSFHQISEMVDLYFDKGEMENKSAFATSEEQIDLWLQFVDMLCCTQLLIKENSKPESFQRIGVLLNDEDLMKALEPHPKADYTFRSSFMKVFQHLIMRGRNTLESGTLLPLDILTTLIDPSVIGTFSVVMAMAPDRNRKYERIFGILQEESEPKAKPTFGLIYDLCSLFYKTTEDDLAELLNQDSFLNRFVFDIRREEAASSVLSQRVSLSIDALNLLFDRNCQMNDLQSCGEFLYASDEQSEMIGKKQEYTELENLFVGFMAGGNNAIIQLAGPDGVGKKYLFRKLAIETGMDILSIDIRALYQMTYDKMASVIHSAVRKCLLNQMLLHLDHIDNSIEAQEKSASIISLLQNDMNIILISSEENTKIHFTKGSLTLIKVPMPDHLQQLKYWTTFAEERDIRFDQTMNLDLLTSQYSLTPQKIRDVIEQAWVNIPDQEDKESLLLKEKDLVSLIRKISQVDFGSLAKCLKTNATFEDLKMNQDGLKELHNACNRLKYRSMIFDQYGFGKKYSYGCGIAILLYGPPGTGKTMAAGVMSNELGLDVYRVDLSEISSKYIGEAEKNLSALFDTARYSNAILFFDEADALFSKRTEIRNSNDKYANGETAYLLQRIEEYSGISILATNNLNNFDEAFKRRMSFLIPVGMPDESVRLELWQSMFPKEIPLDKNVRFEVFAQKAELTGSEIKSAALAAAFMAVEENSPVTQEMLIDAVSREYFKKGRVGIENELRF